MRVQKMLIVDDNVNNRHAANAFLWQYLSNGHEEVKVDFASSADQARIALSVTPTSNIAPYDIVLTDLEMEKSGSGYEVAEMAFRHGAMPFIVTGRDYNMQSVGSRSLLNHGPKTYMLPSCHVIAGKKDNPEVWREIYENAVMQLNGRNRLLFHALRRSLNYNPGGYSARGKSGMRLFSYFQEMPTKKE